MFKNTDKEELYLYHFGLGTWIRNNLIYNNDNIMYAFKENNINDLDEISHLIILEFHNWLSNKI